ncbi:lipase member H-A-like isoform X2 [Lasioglossum baleicum]|uniref:lipase member H-A-like isoform X2 n=1 Tax=Lasioglossum baleicum TaxID=434251 RepID=UPI003FCE5AA7
MCIIYQIKPCCLNKLVAETVGFYCYAQNDRQSVLSTCGLLLLLSVIDYTYTEVSIVNATQLLPRMNLTEKTVMHCHGYDNTPDLKFVADIIHAYLDGYSYNVIAADYRYVTYEFYATSVALVNAVGKVMSYAVERMASAGMNKHKFMLSGHSLGSQIAGCIGRSMTFKVSEILAMDPAGLYFGFPETTINAADAKCVKCVHSEMGYRGTLLPCGHQDYYPNSGYAVQPGCPNPPTPDEQVCSHNMSAIFIQQALIRPELFLSVKCNSWYDFKAGNCDRNVVIPMGENAPCHVTGRFYLQTNPQKPYGRGLQGTFYDKSLQQDTYFGFI